MSTFRLRGLVLVAVVLGSSLCGCESWGKKEPRAARPMGTLDGKGDTVPSIALEGTIGSVAYVQGLRLMRVRGYSLAIGLQGTGSAECPTGIRDQLVKEIRRFKDARINESLGAREEKLPSPEALINSLDTAVVEVVGEVPSGAAEGRPFDLYVKAIDPDVRSLWGGFILPCELSIYQQVSPARELRGRTHAKASGQIFINPFREVSGAPGNADLLNGTIIGGGSNILERKLRLICTVESYSLVQRISEAINRRFGTEPKVADPISPTNIELTVPYAFHGKERRFLDLVTHLPLSSSIAEREARAKLLVLELSRTDVSYEDVALSLEGVGKLAIPFVQELYASPRREVSFYAARTGMRLGHDLAVEIIIQHAKDPKSMFQRLAIRELGDCSAVRKATYVLSELLSDEDSRLRILTYESLRRLNRSALAQVVVGDMPPNFLLEVVPSQGSGLIYAKRTGTRRLALIGGDQMECRTPVFYSKPGKELTITADEGDAMLSVLLKVTDPRGRVHTVGPFLVSKSVMTLVQFLGNSPNRRANGSLEGMGLDYAEILEVLHSLCETGALDAEVRWEEPDVEELVGPLRPMGRPESEL